MEDSTGKVLLDNSSVQEPVIKESTAYYMNSMLRDVVTSGTGYEAALSNMTAAGKTGTTSQNYDRWFVGYTPYYTAAVWTGYDQNEKMRTSGNPAAQLWKKVMSQVHQGLDNKSFFSANGLKSVQYCLDSGMLATEYCAMDPRGSRAASDSVFQSDVPTGACTVHTANSVVRMCKDSPILDSNGNPTGRYRLAGEHCPEESRKTVYVVDYERELATDAATIGDYTALRAYYTDLGDPVCDVHDGTPTDPDPWPSDWPTDDPSLPSEWVWPSVEPTLPPEPTTTVEPEPDPEPSWPSEPTPGY